MEKNEVWLWYKDEVLIDVFVIQEIVEREDDGEPVAILCGEGAKYQDTVKVHLPGRYSKQFFDDMELLEDINDMCVLEEQALVIKICEEYKVPLPKKKK